MGGGKRHCSAYPALRQLQSPSGRCDVHLRRTQRATQVGAAECFDLCTEDARAQAEAGSRSCCCCNRQNIAAFTAAALGSNGRNVTDARNVARDRCVLCYRTCAAAKDIFHSTQLLQASSRSSLRERLVQAIAPDDRTMDRAQSLAANDSIPLNFAYIQCEATVQTSHVPQKPCERSASPPERAVERIVVAYRASGVMLQNFTASAACWVVRAPDGNQLPTWWLVPRSTFELRRQRSSALVCCVPARACLRTMCTSARPMMTCTS